MPRTEPLGLPQHVMVIGRGRVGSALTALFTGLGHPPSHWWSRRDGGSPSDLPSADLVLVAVSDDAIEAVARALAVRPSARNELWMHCSGSRPATILRMAPGLPKSVGCLHPLHAVDGSPVTTGYFAGSTAGIDGEPDAVAVAHALAQLLDMRPVRLPEGTKPLYHAAAVTVAGHATALFAQAQSMLAQCGVSEAESRRMLQPLMAGAVANLADAPAREVITGPTTRGDADVIASHIQALQRLLPEALGLYRTLATTALELSLGDLSDDAVQNLHQALAEASSVTEGP